MENDKRSGDTNGAPPKKSPKGGGNAGVAGTATASDRDLAEKTGRNNLSPAEEAIAIARRKELIHLIQKKNADTNEAAIKQRGGNGGVPGPAPASDRDLEQKTGRSRESVRRAAKREKSIGTNDLKSVIGTSLDQPGELDALGQMKEDDRSEIITNAPARAGKNHAGPNGPPSDTSRARACGEEPWLPFWKTGNTVNRLASNKFGRALGEATAKNRRKP